MMKKTAIVSLALLLAACSSSEYETDIQSESYQENYQTTQAEVDAQNPQIEEQDLTPVATPIAQDTTTSDVTTDDTTANAETMTNAQDDSVQSTASSVTPVVATASLNAPSKGFSIQLATLSDKEKAQTFAEGLQTESTLWLQTKSINDKVVYSVVMGDYGDYDHAKAAVVALPERFQKLKPFVKNFTDKELAATDHFLLLK
ncbi:SPOR domain-containing protein [Vibrio neonatus]|uniref:SPOR domain-containing protein n=1 Tax=Vibrio neonatus TaxID=278860 RepID=UPI0021C4494C|nr:SPOR domain-containing protein [Vibrio neonatus]